MGVASAADDLDAAHAQGGVLVLGDRVGVHRLPEARPAAAGVELRFGAEERLAAADAGVLAGSLGVPVGPSERALGTLLAGNVELFRRQALAPFRVALDQLVAHLVPLSLRRAAPAPRAVHPQADGREDDHRQ